MKHEYDFVNRLRKNKIAMFGLVLLLFFLLVSLLGPFLAPYDPVYQTGDISIRYEKPSRSHFMGTDRFGRDVFSRILFGARISISIGLLATLLSSVVGVSIGLAAGYSGGPVDEILMRFADGLLAFPRILIVILLVAFFTNTTVLLLMAISCTSWMGTARLVRAEILSLKEEEFFLAAVATGIGRLRLIWKHLLPNAAAPVIVAATLQVGNVILLESTLSFLGLGVQPPAPSWGNMVFEGREALLSAWWVAAFPGTAIAAAVIAFNLLGDGVRDAFESR